MIPPQLRWACRRGMLELDLMLQHFLVHAWSGLGASDRTLFVELLAMSDQELYRWLMGVSPAPHRFADLIASLRQVACSGRKESLLNGNCYPLQ